MPMKIASSRGKCDNHPAPPLNSMINHNHESDNARKASHRELPRPNLAKGLLDDTGDLREHRIGVASDHPNHPHDDYEHRSQHDRVFSDILSGCGLACRAQKVADHRPS